MCMANTVHFLLWIVSVVLYIVLVVLLQVSQEWHYCTNQYYCLINHIWTKDKSEIETVDIRWCKPLFLWLPQLVSF